MTQLSINKKFEILNYNLSRKAQSLNNKINQIEYRDEYVAGEWITPQGATAPDEVNVTIGGIPYRFMSFDGGVTEERKSNSFEINHDVDIVSLNSSLVELEQHIHCMPSDNNAGVAKFFIDYCYLPAWQKPIVQSALTMSINISADSQYMHLLLGAVLPKPSSGFGIGDVILFNIRRTPNDPQDTYASDILFIKTALHVPVNSKGSISRYSK